MQTRRVAFNVGSLGLRSSTTPKKRVELKHVSRKDSMGIQDSSETGSYLNRLSTLICKSKDHIFVNARLTTRLTRDYKRANAMLENSGLLLEEPFSQCACQRRKPGDFRHREI